jgi:hypothetical protein
MIITTENVITPLDTMSIGSSFFYPTYDTAAVDQKIIARATELGITVATQSGIREIAEGRGRKRIYGLRVTRVS